jgi:hypothetical protein
MPEDAGRARRVMADINITPLIDVMLVLLIIFMLVAPVAHRGCDGHGPRRRGRAHRDHGGGPAAVTTRGPRPAGPSSRALVGWSTATLRAAVDRHGSSRFALEP